jgi:hypothetical protein
VWVGYSLCLKTFESLPSGRLAETDGFAWPGQDSAGGEVPDKNFIVVAMVFVFAKAVYNCEDRLRRVVGQMRSVGGGIGDQGPRPESSDPLPQFASEDALSALV